MTAQNVRDRASCKARFTTLTKHRVDKPDRRRKMDHMNLAVSRVLKSSPIGIAAQYARSFYDLLANRRKYERTPICGIVRVTFPGYAVESTHVCSCVDISPRGMAMDCPESLLPNTIIVLHAEEHGARRVARVCYSRERGTVYRIGVDFTTDDGCRINSA